MNKTLEKAGKEILLNLLLQCSIREQQMFNRMYAHDKIEQSVDITVKELPSQKLDWAITQVENTIAKKNGEIFIKSVKFS